MPPGERVRERSAIHIFELTAHWHAVRDATGGNPVMARELQQEVRGRLPFDSRIGGQNHFAQLPALEDRLELRRAKFFGTNAIER